MKADFGQALLAIACALASTRPATSADGAAVGPPDGVKAEWEAYDQLAVDCPALNASLLSYHDTNFGREELPVLAAKNPRVSRLDLSALQENTKLHIFGPSWNHSQNVLQ